MTIRSQICLPFAAVTLLAGASLFDGGLAQDAIPQTNPDTASSPVKANASGPSYLEPLNAGETIGVLGSEFWARVSSRRMARGSGLSPTSSWTAPASHGPL